MEWKSNNHRHRKTTPAPVLVNNKTPRDPARCALSLFMSLSYWWLFLFNSVGVIVCVCFCYFVGYLLVVEDGVGGYLIENGIVEFLIQIV